jgi:hypothetical protein
MDELPSCQIPLFSRGTNLMNRPVIHSAVEGDQPRFLLFVPEDYAEIIQQNQWKTIVLARFSRFFSNPGPLCP